MPYTMRKVPNKKCYRITNKRTKRVMAKCSTKKNATKQLRLLRAIIYNKDFVPNASATATKKNKTRRSKK